MTLVFMVKGKQNITGKVLELKKQNKTQTVKNIYV